MKKMKKLQTKPTIENKHMSNAVGVDDSVDPKQQKHINKHTSNIPTSNAAITLIALVITIIVLLILAGVIIAQLTGNGLLNKATYAKDETNKSQAAEAMNLKITNIQISSYTETQTLPNLQYLADKLCEDNDIQYVLTASKEHASLAETDTKPKIDVTNFSSIFTKLKEYPYEFEINSSLQLASIDGVKIADNNDGTVTLTQGQYNSILSRLTALENNSNNTTTNNNYSTEEQVIGTWIDGKTLYRRVVKVFDGTLSSKTFYSYPITNIDYSNAVDYWYTRVAGDNVSSTIIHKGYSFSSEYVNMFTDNRGIYFDGALNYYTIKDLWAIVEYTKTTDTATNN